LRNTEIHTIDKRGKPKEKQSIVIKIAHIISINLLNPSGGLKIN
jgi:hypothetical protein